MTAMSVDVVGSTALDGQMDPGDVRQGPVHQEPRGLDHDRLSVRIDPVHPTGIESGRRRLEADRAVRGTRAPNDARDPRLDGAGRSVRVEHREDIK